MKTPSWFFQHKLVLDIILHKVQSEKKLARKLKGQTDARELRTQEQYKDDKLRLDGKWANWTW